MNNFFEALKYKRKIRSLYKIYLIQDLGTTGSLITKSGSFTMFESIFCILYKFNWFSSFVLSSSCAPSSCLLLILRFGESFSDIVLPWRIRVNNDREVHNNRGIINYLEQLHCQIMLNSLYVALSDKHALPLFNMV